METKISEKPQASKSIAPIADPLNTKITFICQECGHEVSPGKLICTNCLSSLESGMNPILNAVLSFIIICTITCLLGALIGLAFGNSQNGLIGGVVIGVLLSSKSRTFNRQGIWAMMRLGESNTLKFYCPTSVWEQGLLPTIVHLNETNHNIFKSGPFDTQEKTIIKQFLEAQLKPSEINTAVAEENKQQPAQVNHPDGNSTIYIARLAKFMESTFSYDVYVDDKKEIELKNGQSLKIATQPGKHTLKIQVQGLKYWSEAFSFSLLPDETIYITCKPQKSSQGPEIEMVEKKKP